MCGRVIQKSGPLRLAIVEALDVSDSRLGNVPRRYNAAPSQELLVIRHNHRAKARYKAMLKLKHGRWSMLRLPPAITPAGTHAGKPRIHDQKGYQD